MLRPSWTAAVVVLLVAADLLPVLSLAYPVPEAHNGGGGGGRAGREATADKAVSHEHWEHIVRRRSVMARFDSRADVEDEASHIVNVQDYYREVLEQDWPNYRDNEKELFNLLHKLEDVSMQRYLSDDQKASIQEQTAQILELGVHTKPIKGRFIVMFKQGASDYVLDRTVAILQKANRDSDQRVRATDFSTLRNVGYGFIATLNGKSVDLMAKHPMVAHIEEDTALRRSEFTYGQAAEEEKFVTAENDKIPWNLDRLDQHANKLDGQYNPEATGKNVKVYIIDTGVRATHEELKGRVHYAGYDAVDDLTGTHNQGADCNGHGTHCAATAAGTHYGVAKEAEIYNLRALNCQGSGAVSGIVKGIDKIIAMHTQQNDGRPAVISQSLGVKKSESLDTAIKRAVEAGIPMVGAAGNQADLSCNYSPPASKVGISVGATDPSDEVTVFTNTGPCTDIMAPGYHITSASNECDTCTKTMSGTSMATPHVAGHAAILLSLHPQLNAVQLKEKMMEQATKDVVKLTAIASSRAQDTPNRLLYVPSATAQDSDLALKSDGMASVQGRP